jgi:hypothetical protein
MNANVNVPEKNLSTADLAAAAKARAAEPAASEAVPEHVQERQRGPEAANRPAGVADEPLAALFVPDVAKDFRTRWDEIQIGFVDDPRQAVKKADELVAQVMTSLAQTFAKERSELEGVVKGPDAGSTENLRVALRRYRSFFQRLLSL